MKLLRAAAASFSTSTSYSFRRSPSTASPLACGSCWRAASAIPGSARTRCSSWASWSPAASRTWASGLGNIYFLNKAQYELPDAALEQHRRDPVDGGRRLGHRADLGGGVRARPVHRGRRLLAVGPGAAGGDRLHDPDVVPARAQPLRGAADDRRRAGRASRSWPLAALDAADELDVGTAIAAWTGSFLAADLVVPGVDRRCGKIDVGTVIRPKMDALREQVKYGAQGQLANMAALFNYRLDQFLVAAFVSTAGVGHYTVAVGLSESVWWISSAVSLVMLPRLTAMTEEAAQEVTPLVCRNTLLISVVGGRRAGGRIADRDQGAVRRRVLPGLVLAAGAADAGDRGGQRDARAGELSVQPGARSSTTRTPRSSRWCVSIGLDFIAVPLFEVEGAAAMSSVAYVCALIATLYWYRQVSPAADPGGADPAPGRPQALYADPAAGDGQVRWRRIE